MTAKVQRLDEHILDAEEIITNDAGAWFAHDHEHLHPAAYPVAEQQHKHRHDHRRRSKRGNYDHHPIERSGSG